MGHSSPKGVEVIVSNLWVLAAWQCGRGQCGYGGAPFYRNADEYEQHVQQHHPEASQYSYPYSREDNEAMDAVHKSFKDAGLGHMFTDVDRRSTNGIDSPELDGELIHNNGITSHPSLTLDGGVKGHLWGQRDAHHIDLYHPKDWAMEVPTATIHLGNDPSRAAEVFTQAMRHPHTLRSVSGQDPEWREAMEHNYGANIWHPDHQTAQQTYQGPDGKKYYQTPMYGAEQRPGGWRHWDE